MGETKKCANCSADLADALEGLCPDCLGKLALGSEGQSLKAKGQRTDGIAAVGEVGRDVPIAPLSVIQDPVSSIEHPTSRFGDYELLSEIAQGGMGVVFKARQVSLNRTVAVKMIRAGPFASKEFVHRFRVEASAAAVLQHPNIVAVHEVGVHEGQHFFSMDYVAGKNLSQIVRDGPLPANRVARYVQKIAEAIHYAHQSGILHRDLKPSNVLIDQNDQPRITDFGLAKQLNVESSATLTGEVMGTPGYMPPEQASGNRGAVKAWSDVYSLGAILYHLLTGRAPFAAGSLEETLNQVLHQDPVSIRLLNPAVPRDLSTICLKCLQKEPAKRYASAQLLEEDLRRFLDGEPILARPVTAPEKAWRWCKRKPMAATALALVIVVTIGSPLVTLRIYREGQKTQPALAQARIEEGKAWLERAQSYLEEKNFFYAKLMAGRALGFRGFGREKLTDAQRDQFLELLPPGSAEARTAELILRGTDDYVSIWHGPVASTSDGSVSRAAAGADFSPDGRLLASGSAVTNIGLWDVATGKQQATLHGHSNDIACVAFSPDGRLLASASHDKTIRLWDVATQASIATLPGYPRDIQVLAFSPDGRLLAACAESDTTLLWEVPSGRPLPPFVRETLDDAGYWHLAFSPDGAVLALVCYDGTIELWDIISRKKRELKGPSGGLSVAFSPDGHWIASGGWNGRIRLWEMPRGEPIQEFQSFTAITSVQFSPDGQTLASRDYTDVHQLWAVPQGILKATVRPSTPRVIGRLSFSPDGSLLASGGAMVQLCELTSGHVEAELAVDSRSEVAVSRDGTMLASARTDQTVALWDLSSGNIDPQLLEHPSPVRSVALSPDSRWLASGCEAGIVRLWEVATGRLEAELGSHTSEVRTLAFSPDGTLLASAGSYDHAARLWDVARKTPRHAMASLPYGDRIYDLAFDPQGRWLATAGGEIRYWVKLWDVATGQLKEPPLTPRGTFASVTFSPDGQLLAAGEEGEGVIDLWEVGSGQLKARLSGHTEKVRGLDFSRDSRLLASGSDDDTIQLWDVPSTRLLGKLRGHTGDILSVAFTPDGRRLISGSTDTTIRIWNVEAALNRSLDYASFVNSFDLEGRNVAWKVFRGKSDTAQSVPMRSFTGKSLVAVLQSGMSEEEVDRTLFRRFLRAHNLNSARLLVDRYGKEKWKAQSETLGRAYLQEAKTVLDYEGYLLAAQHAARASTFLPEKAAQGWHVTALAERGLKRWPESLAAIEQAIALERNNAEFWHDKALILEQQDQKPASREALVRAIELARQADGRDIRLESWRRYLEQLGRDTL